MARPVYSGGVAEHKLFVRGGVNATLQPPSGLWFRRNYCDLLSNDGIYQRGFAHVWPAHDGDKTGFEAGRFSIHDTAPMVVHSPWRDGDGKHYRKS